MRYIYGAYFALIALGMYWTVNSVEKVYPPRDCYFLELTPEQYRHHDDNPDIFGPRNKGEKRYTRICEVCLP